MTQKERADASEHTTLKIVNCIDNNNYLATKQRELKKLNLQNLTTIYWFEDKLYYTEEELGLQIYLEGIPKTHYRFVTIDKNNKIREFKNREAKKYLLKLKSENILPHPVLAMFYGYLEWKYAE